MRIFKLMYLNCKTYYSIKYGTFSIEELIATAVDRGANQIALTDINNTCACWEFVQQSIRAGIKPIVGVEVRNGDQLLYILLAANHRGLTWINEFLSEHLLDKKDFPEDYRQIFFKKPEDGFVIYPLDTKPVGDLLSNERIGVLPTELTKLFRIDWKMHGNKFVLRHPVTIQNKTYHQVHRLLRAIDKNVLGTKLPKEATCSPDETFVSPKTLLEKFSDYPSIVTNTYRLMDACNLEFDFKTDKNKKSFSATVEDDRVLLEKLATDGFLARYGPRNKIAEERLRKELKIINDLGFNSYFLINYDFTRYAQGRGFYYVGRGSGANSIVAYCLRITDVDPIELNLFFERFLNPERTSPPDFDIDFSWRDRDEVTDYIFKRYGKKHVALLGSYPTFKWEGVIHELGKVFGQTQDNIKKLQRSFAPEDNDQRLILKYGKLMLGFPTNTSLHPCGILISEKPITEYAALFMPPKGFPTAQIDMFVAEDIGLNKFDILSQRGLGHIKDCLRLIKENHGVSINIHDFEKFRYDDRIKTQIREANTIGCFYIESPAMRQLLKKLRCDDYLTLVAASSIIRPGVAESGMMREYILRYHNRDKIEYLHPVFEEHLSETFGVMVFQEDVIKIAHYYAGLSLGDADILRRAMSGKYRTNNEFSMIKIKFFEGAKRLGRPEETTTEAWRQMESFAGYSFNKAHSASFAVESYMSLYLKTYYPMEFMVAVINNFGGFYSRELYFMELLKTGCTIQAPCINHSEEYTKIIGQQAWVGFIHIKQLQSKVIELILEERKLRGQFTDQEDFIKRTNIGLEQLNKLISIRAFRFTGKTKKELLWDGDFLQKTNEPVLNKSLSLFKEPALNFEMPDLTDNRLDDLYDELALLGFTLSNPFEIADADPTQYVKAADFSTNKGKTITVLSYFIDRKQVTTKHNTEMFFGTFVDPDLDWVDTVHFPEAAKKYPLHEGGFYLITGKVVEDFGVFSQEVHYMKRVGHRNRAYENLG